MRFNPLQGFRCTATQRPGVAIAEAFPFQSLTGIQMYCNTIISQISVLAISIPLAGFIDKILLDRLKAGNEFADFSRRFLLGDRDREFISPQLRDRTSDVAAGDVTVANFLA